MPIPDQIKTFIKEDFFGQFSGALGLIKVAEQAGIDFARTGIKRVIFSGCGAPFYLMRSLAYWGWKVAVNTDIRVVYSAELVSQNSAALDEDTLVILGSHSGTTQETVAAAEFLKQKPCKTLSITQNAASPLGKTTDDTLAYGNTTQGYFSAFILLQAFFSAFLHEREKGWDLHPILMASLPNLPEALAEAKIANLGTAKMQAAVMAGQKLLYVVGAGPMFTTAFVFASCFLMEMQWMHAHAFTAADFFHGPFEVIDQSVPVLVLVGEDPGRSEGERVRKFCAQYAGPSFIYDSRNFQMKGIHTSIRPIVAPYILDSALTNLVEELAVLNDHPLTTRRYMGKVVY